MDDPNDFEWGFPKAKNRASNGTLHDTYHVSHIFSLETTITFEPITGIRSN
jgi:hypothetical protein